MQFSLEDLVQMQRMDEIRLLDFGIFARTICWSILSTSVEILSVTVISEFIPSVIAASSLLAADLVWKLSSMTSSSVH